MEHKDIELILINISGQDKPGVTAALTSILARYNAMVLDIGQADIHHTLSLGILFRTTPQMSGDIMKDLLFKAYDMGVKIRFSPISIEEYESWVSRQGEKPMDHHHPRPPAHSPSHRPGIGGNRRPGTQHRRHSATHRPSAP